MSEFVRSVQWICKSPYRIGHKTKNWFIKFPTENSFGNIEFVEGKVIFERFHSGNNVGQNVNKVERGNNSKNVSRTIPAKL